MLISLEIGMVKRPWRMGPTWLHHPISQPPNGVEVTAANGDITELNQKRVHWAVMHFAMPSL